MSDRLDDDINERVESCMTFCTFVLKISGCYFGEKKTMTLLNRFHQRLVLANLVCLTTGIIMGIYTHSKRFDLVIELVCLAISNAVIDFKIYLFVFHSEDIDYLFHTVRSNFFVHDRHFTLENKKIIKEVLDKVRKLLFVYVSLMVYSSVVFIFITPFANLYLEKDNGFLANNTDIDEKPLKILPLQLWLPFDITESPRYELGFLFVQISSVAMCIGFTASEATIITLMMYCCGHYDVFCDSLRNAMRNVKIRLQQKNVTADVCEFDHSTTTTFTSEVEEKEDIGIDKKRNSSSNSNGNNHETRNISEKLFQQEMENYLRECIAHHQKLLEFTKKLDQLWEFAFFIQFLTVSILICFIGFQAMSGPLDANLFKMLGYLVSVLFQLFLYCAFGSNLTAKSAEVFNAVYETDWYNQNENYKQITQMIIMRAQKPVFLTAGKFGALCLPLFTSMIKSSYSYLALLRQMQDK